MLLLSVHLGGEIGAARVVRHVCNPIDSKKIAGQMDEICWISMILLHIYIFVWYTISRGG